MATVITSAGTATAPTGRPGQSHLIYASNAALWWLFWVNGGSQTTLRTAYSSNLSSWTTGSTFTLSNNQDRGTNLAVAYKNISSTDVVWIVNNYHNSTNQPYKARYVRATISGTSITFGSETNVQADMTLTDTSNIEGGPIIGFASDNTIHIGQSMTDGSGTGWGNANLVSSTNADLGSSWTAGFSANSDMGNAAAYSANHAMLAQASKNMLWIGDSGDTATTYTDLRYKRAITWTATFTGSALASALGTAQDQNDWSAVRQDDTHVHLVTRSGANTYVHRTFNGSTWAAGASITNQNSKAGAGIFLTTNGTDVWLFIIDNDAANTVRYCQYSTAGGTWGSWNALESTTKTRTWLSGSQVAGNGNIAVIWSEVNGGNFDIVTTPLALGGGGAVEHIDRRVERGIMRGTLI